MHNMCHLETFLRPTATGRTISPSDACVQVRHHLQKLVSAITKMFLKNY